MASGPEAGLELVDNLADGVLGKSHLLYAVQAALLAKLGRAAEARAAYLRAAALCTNAAERAVLESKAVALAPQTTEDAGD